MASTAMRVSFRITMVILVLFVLFYVGRPLYWKISATVHDIRQNKRTVKQGLSQIVYEAQKTVGWFHDESDSGAQDDGKMGRASARRSPEGVLRMFFDPLAAKTVFESRVNTTVIPLGVQRSVDSFNEFIRELKRTTKTPKVAKLLMSRLAKLKKNHYRCQHMDMFRGEIVGAFVLASDHALLKPTFKLEHVKVMGEGSESSDGVMYRDEGVKLMKVLSTVNLGALRESFSRRLGDKAQSAGSQELP